MIKITDALRGEHAVIYRLLSHVESESVPHDLMQSRTLAGELEAALEGHARLEDELLFCHLESLLPQQGPLAVMRAEHQEIEGLLASLAASSDASDAYAHIKRLVVVARGHFAKEEQVLFPLAEQVLDESQLQELGARWASQCGVAVRARPGCG